MTTFRIVLLQAIFLFMSFEESMNDISFKSYVKIGSKSEFLRETSSLGKRFFVDYPWTIKESVIGRSAYTKNIQDCTVMGITDGIKVLLLHLCPTDKFNWNKDKIVKMIKENFDLASGYVQGFILGSKPNSKNSPKSTEFFNYIKAIPNELKIPCSSFKGGNYIHDVAYIGDRDMWLISNELMTNKCYQNMTAKEKIRFTFDDAELAETDEYLE